MQRQFFRHDSHAAPAGNVNPPSSSSARIQLEIVRGRARQKIRPVQGPAFLIGTAADCDLVLGDPQFPEVHAYIRTSEEGVTVRHLGFTPPLTVNGAVAGCLPLADGDRIRTGPYEFLVHIRPLAGGDDESSSGGASPLRLPAAMDRVEDEVGNALVQQLLEQIRGEMLTGSSRLKLFVDPDKPLLSPEGDEITVVSKRYARSS